MIDSTWIEAPARAAVATDFEVVVYTSGGGCHSFESTDVTPGDTELVIEPYDRRVIPSGGESCSHVLGHLAHAVTLHFASPGTKTILVRGWDWSREPVELVVPVVLE